MNKLPHFYTLSHKYSPSPTLKGGSYNKNFMNCNSLAIPNFSNCNFLAILKLIQFTTTWACHSYSSLTNIWMKTLVSEYNISSLLLFGSYSVILVGCSWQCTRDHLVPGIKAGTHTCQACPPFLWAISMSPNICLMYIFQLNVSSSLEM